MSKTLATYQTDDGQKITLTDDAIRKYISTDPNVTDREVMLFAALCKAQHLNPFIRDAYLVKYGNSPATMVTGKEVFTKRAQRNPKFQGFQAGITVVTQDGQLVEREGSMKLQGEVLVGGWAKVYMDGYKIPFFEEVSLDEYAGKKRDGSFNKTWASRPATMIRKVALTHALREAMPDDFQGLYDEAEMSKDYTGQAVMVEAPQGGMIDPSLQAATTAPNHEPVKAEAVAVEAVLEQQQSDQADAFNF